MSFLFECCTCLTLVARTLGPPSPLDPYPYIWLDKERRTRQTCENCNVSCFIMLFQVIHFWMEPIFRLNFVMCTCRCCSLAPREAFWPQAPHTAKHPPPKWGEPHAGEPCVCDRRVRIDGQCGLHQDQAKFDGKANSPNGTPRPLSPWGLVETSLIKTSSGTTEGYGLTILDIVKHAAKTIIAEQAKCSRRSDFLNFFPPSRPHFSIPTQVTAGDSPHREAIP